MLNYDNERVYNKVHLIVLNFADIIYFKLEFKFEIKSSKGCS